MIATLSMKTDQGHDCLRLTTFQVFLLNLFHLVQDESVGPVFSIMEGGTYLERKNEWVLFSDFYMKIIGETADGGYLVCSFGTRILGKSIERYGLPPSG